ncbi:MAG: ABC transporter permease [Myxococcota bacterium]
MSASPPPSSAPGPASSARKHPLLQLIRARIRVFVREPAALFWVFIFPALLAVALGVAFRDRPPEPARVGVAADRPDAARLHELLAKASDVTLVDGSSAELSRKLDKGALDVIVGLDAPTAGSVPAAAPTAHYRFDPQRAEGRYARLVIDRELQKALGRIDATPVLEETTMPRGARYIDFLLPGLIAMNLMGSALWGVGYGMVQERSKKLMRRFATTPLSKTQFLASYIISRLVFLAGEVAFLVGFGALAFGVEVQGSVATLLLVALVGVLAFTGLAVLCASRTSSVEVVSGLVNALTLPMWLLSGTFFSYERFPEAVQPIIRALPLTALNDALRAVTNDGATLVDVLPQLGILAAWGGVAFTIGVRLFRWR